MATTTITDWGVKELITSEELETLLKIGHPLKVKLGVDPTSPDLHLGHGVVLRKLRQFQELDHQTFLVIGDFTASIGDPSGANKTRPVLSQDEIKHNMETYLHQAGHILDLQKTQVVYNSEWLQPMTLGQFIGFAMQISVNTLIERDDFRDRLKDKQSLGFHELFYPLSQAIDSVHLEIDVEIGGWDQRLNMLMGRELQKKLGKNPQAVVAMKPLVGLDGTRKMSKSYGNYVGLNTPADQMFGQLMSIPDKLINSYAELAALMSDVEIKKLDAHPREAKATVAKKIVELYHNADEAKNAEAAFNRTFRDKKVDSALTNEITVTEKELGLTHAVILATNVSSSEARRLIDQGGVKVDQKTITDSRATIDLTKGDVQLQTGKHRFFLLRYKE